MNAADIMTHPVIALGVDAPLTQAIRLMTAHKVSGLPVVGKEGQVVGILTEGDLLRRVETGTAGEPAGWLTGFLLPGRQASKYVKTHGRRVGDVMSANVISITEDTPLSEVVALMLRHRVKRLPVVRDGRLMGIVSRADVVRRVGEALPATAVSVGDRAIQSAIIDQMQKEPWAPGNAVSIVVEDGVVQLDGYLFDIRAREALGVLAENTPGVVRVVNRIVCIEPSLGIVTYDPGEPDR